MGFQANTYTTHKQTMESPEERGIELDGSCECPICADDIEYSRSHGEIEFETCDCGFETEEYYDKLVEGEEFFGIAEVLDYYGKGSDYNFLEIKNRKLYCTKDYNLYEYTVTVGYLTKRDISELFLDENDEYIVGLLQEAWTLAGTNKEFKYDKWLERYSI